MKIANQNHMKQIITSLAIIVFCSFGLQGFGQSGAVYPVSLDLCETTASFSLNWVGSGTVDHWERNDGAGWSNITTTNTTINVTTPNPGVYNYRAYINLGGGSFAYSIISTVTIYAESKADGTVSFSYNSDARCEGNNVGSIALNNGYTGNISTWVYSTNNKAPWSNLGESNTTLTFEDLTQTTYYKVRIQNGACPAVLTSNTATIPVNPDPVAGTISTDKTSICGGTSETANLSVSGNSGTTFSWQRENTGVYTDVSTGTSFTTPAHTAGTYNYRLQAKVTCVDENSATITNTDESNIIQITSFASTANANPSGARAVAPADTTSRIVSVTPVNGSVVRWESSPDNQQWTPLSATGNSLTYQGLTTSIFYRPVLKNGACAELSSSSPAKITVSDAGSITAPTTSFCSPSSATNLTVSNAEAITYKWQRSTSPFTTWIDITSDNSVLAVSGLTETTKYRINADNGNDISSEVTLTVSDSTITGSLTANEDAVCSADGTTRTITLSGNTGNVSRWESSTTNGAPWTQLTNTTSTLSFNNLTQSTYYRAIVKNGACPSLATNSKKITVVSGGEVSGSTDVCAADANVRSLTLSNYTGVIDYWEKSNYNAATSSFEAYTNIGFAGSSSITYSSLTQTARYRAVIESACTADVVSSPATVTVYSSSVGGNLAGAKTVRPGNNSGTITLTGNVGDILRWESSPTGNSPWNNISNTSTSLGYSNLTTTTYYRAIVKNGPCSEAISSNTIKITVANAGFVTGAKEVCSGDSASNTLILNNHEGTINRWQRSLNAGVSWIDIPLTAGLTTITSTLLTQTTAYRAVIIEDGGEIYSDSAVIVVNPLPAPNFSVASVCLSKQSVFNNTSSITSGSIINYKWVFETGQSSNNPSPNYTYSTSGTKPVTLTLTSNKLCEASITKNATVNALPSVDFSFSNVCDQQQVSFVNNSVLAGSTLTHSWNFDDVSSTSPQTDPNYTFSTYGNFDVELKSTSSQGCTDSAMKTVTIFEKPKADFAFTNVCFGNTMTFSNASSLSVGNLSYSWDFGDLSGASTLENPNYSYQAADSFDVTLTTTTANGCMDTESKRVQVYPMPNPSYSVTDHCFGLATIFSNNSTISAGTLTFGWDYTDGNTALATSPTHTFGAAGAYNVELTAISDNNCTATFAKQVVIYPVPSVNFNAFDVCDGDSVNFLNLSSFNDSIAYAWNFGDGSAINVSEEPNHFYANTGNYQVKLVGETKNFCSDSITKTINVNPNPVANFTSNVVCEIDSTFFTNSSTIASGIISTHDWEFGDGKTSSALSPQNFYGNEGVFNAILRVTSAKGCSDSITQQVFVNGLPQPNFVANNICRYDSATFINQSTNISAGSIYTWDFGDGSGTAIGQNQKHLYSNHGIYDVKLFISGGNGCSDSTQKTIEIWPVPNSSFSFNNACEGSSIQFNNQSTIPSGINSFTWNFGFSSSIASDPSILFSTSGNYPVSLTATSDKGCVDDTTQLVAVYPNPQPSFAVNNECIGNSSFFTNTSSIANGTLSFAWDFDDGGSDTIAQPVYLFALDGKYEVTLVATSNNGCKGSVKNLTEIYPSPLVKFSTVSKCALDTTTFTNNSSISSGTLSHFWDFGDGNNTTTENPQHVFAAGGNYSVQLISTSSFGCSDSVSVNHLSYHLPIISFSFDSVCEGFTTTFSNNSSIQGGKISDFVWDFGDQRNSIQKDPQHQYFSAGGYQTSLLATSDKGCKTESSQVVPVYHMPLANFTVEPVCFNEASEFVNTTFYSPNGNGTLSYNWKPKPGENISTQNLTFLYEEAAITAAKLIVTSSEGGCTDSISKYVTVWRLPYVFAGRDTAVNKGFPFFMMADADSGAFNWTPNLDLDNDSYLQPEIRISETTNFTLNVIDKNGCENNDEVTVEAINSYALYLEEKTISNLVTPDGNGENETWKIENIEKYPDNHVVIYDRWGQDIWEKDNYDNTWNGVNRNGDALPDGTYYYLIYFDNSEVKYNGPITLLRNLN